MSVQPEGQAAEPSVLASRSHVGVEAAVSVQPAGQSAVPSVLASRSQVGVVASAEAQPAGQSAVPFVAASRSQMTPLLVAVPVHDAGTASVADLMVGWWDKVR